MALSAVSRLGPYEIFTLLDEDGMEQVYKAKDTRLDRIVAIKVLLPHIAKDSSARARFERKAKAVSALDHPHICTLFDAYLRQLSDEALAKSEGHSHHQ
jgi:serine/threonine protein kinase